MADQNLPDLSAAAAVSGPHGLGLRFDPTEVVDGLRMERYLESAHTCQAEAIKLLQGAYYTLRPVLPAGVRTGVQRAYYKYSRKRCFPAWPVDFSVDRVLQGVLAAILGNQPGERVPFIWFWPDGLQSCAVMTHDVETARGRDFCGCLMDWDDAYGIKSAFQIIPERRYRVSEAFLESIRGRGFEINVHDLNHDGRLFHSRKVFEKRAARINRYLRNYNARGFRAGAMYRQPAWFGSLEISYDMSIPNAAHLEPQQGGCCTVMPYFIGNILELPLTTTQDFALINVLRHDTVKLWLEEIEGIASEHGLISFIVHPDYMLSEPAQRMYKELLSRLAAMRSAGSLWIASPGEINDWWRERAAMRLVRSGDNWQIEGAGKERARIAYAGLVQGRLCYFVDDQSPTDRGRVAPVQSGRGY
jgi:hypothetical protein